MAALSKCNCYSYWKKAIPLEELLAVNNEAEKLAWSLQADSGEHSHACWEEKKYACEHALKNCICVSSDEDLQFSFAL